MALFRSVWSAWRRAWDCSRNKRGYTLFFDTFVSGNYGTLLVYDGLHFFICMSAACGDCGQKDDKASVSYSLGFVVC